MTVRDGCDGIFDSGRYQNNRHDCHISSRTVTDRMVMRDLYGKIKTAPTEEERERARKEYLDRRGVPESFRW